MRAIVFDPDAPRKFAFAQAPDPVPAAPNELLIEVKAISLNFGEVYYGDNAEHPGDIPGWDSAGVVVTAAADGSGPPAGTRVAGAAWSQGWAQRRVLASENVAVIPDSVDFETAAALPVAGVTAVQSIRRLGPALGKRVLVTGASGGVGRLADAYGLLDDGGTVISVGAASGQSTVIDFEAARMARKNNRIEPFMATWPLGEELQYVLDLTGRGQLDAQVGYRDSWDNLDSAIDALLGRRVAGKAALTVS
ncbi:alcohol dehydrogenase catalytic domain-containing protein [Mycolicibacterium sp. P9-22]|uniref:alcohol dehydrogenase catalytic domain-containing protein n=1 Tax=Mycolicibacterium sp. P9-22 TaxID=2024613 RepID=UPI0011F08543|nr:alcohol dehydrogenase [Mycolicibacterium sp. P9-22]KAA0117078.1 alcohol dehydrogenase [Mycolicibacterium sp. P9-22]